MSKAQQNTLSKQPSAVTSSAQTLSIVDSDSDLPDARDVEATEADGKPVPHDSGTDSNSGQGNDSDSDSDGSTSAGTDVTGTDTGTGRSSGSGSGSGSDSDSNSSDASSEPDERDKAAITIQAWWRGTAVRREVQAFEKQIAAQQYDAAATLQSRFRSFKSRQRHPNKRRAIRKLQFKHFKKWIPKRGRKFKKMMRAARLIQRVWNRYRHRKAREERNKLLRGQGATPLEENTTTDSDEMRMSSSSEHSESDVPTPSEYPSQVSTPRSDDAGWTHEAEDSIVTPTPEPIDWIARRVAAKGQVSKKTKDKKKKAKQKKPSKESRKAAAMEEKGKLEQEAAELKEKIEALRADGDVAAAEEAEARAEKVLEKVAGFEAEMKEIEDEATDESEDSSSDGDTEDNDGSGADEDKLDEDDDAIAARLKVGADAAKDPALIVDADSGATTDAPKRSERRKKHKAFREDGSDDDDEESSDESDSEDGHGVRTKVDELEAEVKRREANLQSIRQESVVMSLEIPNDQRLRVVTGIIMLQNRVRSKYKGWRKARLEREKKIKDMRKAQDRGMLTNADVAFTMNEASLYKIPKQELKDMRSAWKILCEGRDWLHLAQVGTLLRVLGQYPARGEIVHMTKELDRNGDGQLEWDEFLKWWRLRKTLFQSNFLLSELFSLFDHNNSGNVSVLELQETMRSIKVPITDEESEEMIRILDTDMDGTVSFLEFCSVASGSL